MPGRSINLFLVDGSASGMRIAEIGLSTIKAIVCPRASLASLSKREESKRTGVYFLVGPDQEKLGRQKIYIGEGDVILNRLSAHDKDDNKDFWSEAILFISKDENLTKAHGRYLESRFIQLATEANRCNIDNGTQPSGERLLPEASVSEMEEFVVQAKLLLATLGYNIFEPQKLAVSDSNVDGNTTLPTFKFSGAGFSAILDVDEENGLFVVRVNSEARLEEAQALQETYKNLREQLVSDGTLVRRNNCYSFVKSYGFSAITAAAQVVSGQSVNGRVVWKTQEGLLFKDWQEARIDKE